MPEWNPVEGMQELTWEELRVGDDVVQKSDFNVGTYTLIRDVQPYALSRVTKYYLVERKISEPEGRGDLVEIYRLNPRGTESEEVEFYIRTRPKFSDGKFSNEEAWTDESNIVTRTWRDILNRVEDNKDYAIRTYTASYKEN